MKPIEDNAAAKILLWSVLAAYLAMGAYLAADPISFDFRADPLPFYIAGGILPFALYARWRRMDALRTGFECMAAVLLLAVPILVGTYAAMRVGMPLTDQLLMGMDRAIGFDWLAFVGYIDAWPLLAGALARAYSSFPYQLLLLPLLLACVGQPVRAYAMVFAYGLVCFVASAIGTGFPALGAFAENGLTQADFFNINVKFGYFFLEQFHAARAEQEFVLQLGEAAGILTFPSVHAAVAALCLWAAWKSRPLRYPFLVLNVLMAVSAVSHGSHYLIDVVAGIGVAAACISVTICVFYRAEAKRSPVLRTVARMSGLLRRRPEVADAS